MLKRMLSVLLLLIAVYGFAQNSDNKSGVSLQQQKLDALKGTYELKRVDTRSMSLLPSDLADIIEKNRKENENAEVRLNNEVILIVYPKSRIQGTTLPGKQ